MLRKHLLLILALVSAGCEQQPAAQAAVHPPAGVVDSILPVEEEVRRFKAQFTKQRPTELKNAAASRETLLATFRAALQANDTQRLRSLAIDAAEFIELYYPHTQYTRPPYRQSPALVWFFIEQNTEKGLMRSLARFAGQPLKTGPLECDEAITQGPNRLWNCKVPLETSGKTTTIRLFGAILERQGRFKFVSLANDF